MFALIGLPLKLNVEKNWVLYKCTWGDCACRMGNKPTTHRVFWKAAIFPLYPLELLPVPRKFPSSFRKQTARKLKHGATEKDVPIIGNHRLKDPIFNFHKVYAQLLHPKFRRRSRCLSWTWLLKAYTFGLKPPGYYRLAVWSLDKTLFSTN